MKSFKILIATAITLSATSAWADLTMPGTSIEVCSEVTGLCSLTNDVCSPKVHFKFPEGWLHAYIMIGGNSIPFPKADAEGWSTIDLGTSKSNNDQFFFITGDRKHDCNDAECVTTKGVSISPQQPRQEGFTCKMLGDKKGSEVWIMEHPDPKKAGQVYMTFSKPDIKDFYVFIPQYNPWISSTPIINEDGKDHELSIDTEHCGWYYRRYIDEEIPSSVLIHMDDDEAPYKHAIGYKGDWSEGTAEPIPLDGLFAAFSSSADYQSALYFVADKDEAEDNFLTDDNIWSTVRPDIIGNCSYVLSATIYDTDASLHPSFSCWSQGGEGCQAALKGSSAAQGVDREVALLAIETCIGVTPGIVETSLDPTTKKPKLSTLGKKCFIDEKYFNQLFNYTEGVNEKTFFDMPFSRTANGKWEFDSDYYTSPGLTVPVMGGFYPAEGKTDAMVLAVDPSQKPVPAARTKRMAEGPVFWGPALRQLDPKEGVAKIDVFCNGPGWNGGYSCDGLFADGESTEAAITSSLKLSAKSSLDDCVFGWSCGYPSYAPAGWPMYVDGSETNGTQSARWRSDEGTKSKNGGRNQHFCFESHAKFKFKRGLKFSIRGDDDIWVYIDNKLAVDLGGTHLSAPGYVDLDKFMPDAELGSAYDIDIFFCDRRTTMSNMRINSNMLIYQREEDFQRPVREPKSSSSATKATSSSSTSKDSKSSSSVSKDSKDSKSSSSTSKDAKSSSSNKNSKSSSSSKKATSSSSSKEYSKPSFRVKMVAPFEFEIVLDEKLPTIAKQYAVMDMNGHVLSTGELSSADTRVKVPTSGSYIVNVGLGYKQVNVK